MSTESPQSLPTLHSSPVPTERRSFRRYPIERKVLCQAEARPNDNVWLLGRSRDISLGGFAFHLHRRFEPGMLLTVDFEGPDDKPWENFQVFVKHATQRTDGFWVLGCTFLRHLSEDQLQAWLRTGLPLSNPPS